ncbi:hypothetical protein LHP98_09685 [Rhodobacter sp. Har01]|uniref:hypothetical protein n=1 Tax=Rhodobacter sp. Har01 TaxID=2883999 RepID=UPI001D063510|nr:hypothetical protein [Rhodobacter sp. Har01]MCB6178400.1 hypothetical protein [Rhodobacter sp. Har01]
MRRLCLFALIALCTTPAAADPAADYVRLRQALPTILFGNDIGLHLQLNAEVIKRLEGRWTLVAPLMQDGLTFPAADALAKACDRAGYQVAPEGTLGLTLTLPTKTKPYVIHLRYAGGTTYLASVDEAGLMARLFPGKDFEDLQPDMLYSTLLGGTWQGYVSLLPAGDDLVLIQPQSRPPELLARCP